MSGCNEVLDWNSRHGRLPVRLRINGGGSRRVVLMIHGTGSSGRIWDGLVSRLPEGTYVAPDTPGMGDSPGPAGSGLSFADWLDFFSRVGAGAAAVSSNGKCHIVGHSLGGAIAAHLAQEEWVDTVSLISPATSAYCTHRSALPGQASEDGRIVLVGGRLGNLVRDPRSIGREGAAMLREDYEKARPLLERGMPWPLFPDDESSLLKGKQVLLIWGDDDRVISPSFYLRLRDDLDLAGIAVEAAALWECGHIPMLEQADDLARRLLAFWDRCSPAKV